MDQDMQISIQFTAFTRTFCNKERILSNDNYNILTIKFNIYSH